MVSVPVEVSLRQDEEYRRLSDKHRSHEARLKELQSKLFLTEEEKIEEVNIKKQKLHLKDRMETIARRYREVSS
jgi:uncharacterized protein YdcH (DUF465 family)